MIEQATKRDGPRLPHALGLLAFLVVTAMVACRLDRPPAPLPATAPPSVFSAERAAAHLRIIADQPHPMGSVAHDRVRDYLLQTLTALGVHPAVHRAVAVSMRYRVAGSVQNVLARIRGTERGPAVLLAAHYDSVPAGPGAADDGAGVAALLETARALRAGAPLRRDVILLFSDGEEAGLLGAEAFVREHPWRKDVGVACNFEARGTSGPSMLFETSNGNAGLVSAFAGSAPHPAGSSLAVSVYRALPNDTDLTVFLRSGMAGLNFGLVEGGSGYHTPQDRLASLDLRSLQQEGENALALVHSLSHGPAEPAKQDAVFFNLGTWLIHYPEGWALSLAFPPLLLLLLAVVMGVRRRDFAPADLLLGFLLFLFTLLVAMGIGSLAPCWLDTLHGSWLPSGDWARSPSYAAAVGCVGPAVLTPFFAWMRRHRPGQGILFGVFLSWAGLTLIVARQLPGGSYLFTWPLLFACAANFGSEGERSYATALRLAVAAVPALLLLAPVTRGLFVAMGLDGPGCAGVALLASLLVLLLLPQFEFLRAAGIRVGLFPLGILLAFVGLGAGTTRWDAAQPRPENLGYALDSGSQTAVLFSSGRRPSTWNASILGPVERRVTLSEFALADPNQRFLVAPSRSLPLPAARVRVLSDERSVQTRTLRLHVTPPPGTREVDLASDEASGGAIVGQALPRRGSRWCVTYQAPQASGFDLTLQTRVSQTATLRVVSVASGLPTELHLPERPAAVTPIQEGDRTLVGVTSHFPLPILDGPVPQAGGTTPAE